MTIETAPRPASDRALRAVAGVVVLGGFLTILDTTVVTVAVDTLARGLDAPLATIQWVTTAYLLALTATIPLTGWAADRFGAARLFAAAVALFTAGSALAAAAWSAESLIAARVVQGLGGGAVLPAGITLIGQVAGPERMGRAMSAVGVPMLLGPALGPVFGGWLLDVASWRWIFLVNLPVGLLTLALGAQLLPAERPTRPAQQLDVRGLALLSPGMALLVYGLSKTAASDPGAAHAVVPTVTGLALVALFTAHALRRRPGSATAVGDGPTSGRPEPLLDLRLLRVPSVAASAVALLLLGGAFLGTLFLLPLYFQQVRGESPLDTGLLLLGQGLAAALAMHLAGRAAERFGAGRVVVAGLVPFALALAALTQVGETTSYLAVEGALLLFGVGMGTTMMTAMTAAYRTLARPQVARATALLTIVQRLGSSLGVALVAVSLQRGGAGAAGAAPAGAFADTFRWPLLLVLLALPAAALLTREARRT
ncbi:DHA2 family efflux MFS transporter permease subunit [Conexibacter arvalis]|uniref:EmrB/QacA subfamily drug resistance transporter n=1 Tax=Conexibacter arvalis TaxID=912552 RepID=A0A840I912_9ACTN|nr:DHA2 family efflux MFS transporter permease subunit [Conexibacter arvalis]MBB4660733.1 EmrB/QacA subfamily drug resistance transporter [Conexibacter arvalis]